MQQRKGRFNEMLMSSDCFSERFLMDEKPKKSLHPLKIFLLIKQIKEAITKVLQNGNTNAPYRCRRCFAPDKWPLLLPPPWLFLSLLHSAGLLKWLCAFLELLLPLYSSTPPRKTWRMWINEGQRNISPRDKAEYC